MNHRRALLQAELARSRFVDEWSQLQRRRDEMSERIAEQPMRWICGSGFLLGFGGGWLPQKSIMRMALGAYRTAMLLSGMAGSSFASIGKAATTALKPETPSV